MRLTLIAAFCLLTVNARAADKTLSSKQITDGWILLFDGETTFGWIVEGKAVVEDGHLILGGGEKPTELRTSGSFGSAHIRWSFRQDGSKSAVMTWRGESRKLSAPDKDFVTETYEPGRGGVSPIVLTVPASTTLTIRDFALQPQAMKPIFNGTDLSGWKQFTGDAKREKSKFRITAEGSLNVKDGPGDLQTEEQYDDFILQLECVSNGKHLNSGIFFRCLPGQYQQGYEAQIRNEYKDGDRTKPVDFGTGAIYRRQPARKVVSNDGEWFTITVMASGNRLRTWVNGYPTADFVDERPAHENGRNGSKLGKGAISIQGHDPTTDLSFRNLRIVELK